MIHYSLCDCSLDCLIGLGTTIRNNRSGGEKFLVHEFFFLKPACLQEFFLGHTTYFGGGIDTPPPVISNGPALIGSMT